MCVCTHAYTQTHRHKKVRETETERQRDRDRETDRDRQRQKQRLSRDFPMTLGKQRFRNHNMAVGTAHPPSTTPLLGKINSENTATSATDRDAKSQPLGRRIHNTVMALLGVCLL